MTTQAAHAAKISAGKAFLYMVLELSDTTWKVLFRTAAGKQRNCSVKARDVDRLLAQISEARQRLGLAREACVLSCYEAGRDGFWLHRKLEASGVDNLIVDSSSIEVPRRARHRKTDRLDLAKLMEMLLRWARGEAKVWSVVHVPSMAEEDLRQLSRAIGRMKSERLQHRARIKSLLATQGIKVMAVGGEMWVKRVLGMGMWNGAPLGEHLAEDLILEGQRLSLIEQHLTKLKLKRDELMATSQQPAAVKARRLVELRAIAQESSFVFVTEMYGWRRFENARQVGGSIGVVSAPWKSGSIDRDQGITKAGNGRMRTMLVEIAHCWLRYQPTSALSLWWERRYANTSGRERKAGYVALARKLAVALWRYLEQGIVPAGAVLKPVRVVR